MPSAVVDLSSAGLGLMIREPVAAEKADCPAN